jgi:hypothetical protein
MNEKLYMGYKRLKVGELIEQLSQFSKDDDVEIFVKGEIYPVLGVKRVDELTVEIGCGWAKI